MTTNTDTLPRQLPPGLLKRLRAKKPKRSRNLEAMQEAAQFFGIPFGSKPKPDAWNRVIDALDHHTPDWRGKPAPKVNAQTTELLAGRREAPRSTCTQVSVGMRGA